MFVNSLMLPSPSIILTVDGFKSSSKTVKKCSPFDKKSRGNFLVPMKSCSASSNFSLKHR